MSQSRISCVSGFLVALLIGNAIYAVDKPTTLPAVEPIAQLEAGKAKGTYHLVFQGTARCSMPGKCALIAASAEGFSGTPDGLHLDHDGDFRFEADLRPGTYYMTVRPSGDGEANYWPSKPQTIHIDKSGHLCRINGIWAKPGAFVLDRRMTGLSPSNAEVADAKTPTLKWAAVSGATHYRGDFRGFANRGEYGTFDVEETHFVVGAGLSPNQPCYWQISAIDAAGNLIARGESSFLSNGSSPPQTSPSEAVTDVLAVLAFFAERNRTTGGCYLGIQPMEFPVPKDPTAPLTFNEGTQYGPADQIAGILITEVFTDSPAMHADLLPDDVIIAVDGKPIPSIPSMAGFADKAALSQQITAMKPGTQVALTVRRYPRELTLHVTVRLRPGAQEAPAPVPAVVAPAPVGQPVWKDIAAVAPAVYPFKGDPKADHLRLTTQEGLGGDTVGQIAELSDGSIAFGTDGGLSIWDGKEIRSYALPADVGAPGGSQRIKDAINGLFRDSRGRLWISGFNGLLRIDPGEAGNWHLLDFTGNRKPQMSFPVSILSFHEAADGTIFLGGYAGAIYAVDPKTDAVRQIHGNDDDINHMVRAIVEDDKHRVLFAVCGVGILRYDKEKFDLVKDFPVDVASFADLAIDNAGTVWGNKMEGLVGVHADGTVENVPADILPGEYALSLQTDHKGNLWVLTGDVPAVHLAKDPDTGKPAWKYVNDVGAMAMLEASDGSWWFAGYGATRLKHLPLSAENPRALAVDRFKTRVEKAYPNVPKEIAVQAKDIVVGVASRRILRFDGKKWEDLSGQLGFLDVNQVLADSKGTIWLATGGAGLIGLDPGGAVRRFNDDPKLGTSYIYRMAETPDGTLYVGTQHGLYRLRDQKWESVQSDLYQIGDMLVDRHGRVWMTEMTYNKLYVYDGKRFQEVKQQTGIANEETSPSTLRLDPAGDVLIDLPPRPAEKVPKRTFKWNASDKGKIGPPVEVK